ncbi:UDP-glucose:(heptosyl)LPS alpha-1,3-glucosyltransferase [Methylophilaceae bacterium]|nr:UDP-glucose:(heptosyl)LPS alpha-1,3-glucosyltransferase [Methylophilaceae bacterium]
MKFAFLIFKYFPFGGMQRDMLRIARELIKKGHEVEIFTISWDGDLPEDAIDVHLVPTRGFFNYRRYQNFIAAVQQKIRDRRSGDDKFDVVVGFNRMTGLDVYFAADPCFIERAHAQRGFFYRLTPRYRWFAGWEQAIFSTHASTQILLLSDIEKSYFQKWYHTQDERFHFIPPFLSASRFILKDKMEMRSYLRKSFGFGADDFVYLLVGSGFSMKGLDRAISALASLPKDKLSTTRLVAVGQDNPKPFMKMAKRLGVAHRVTISSGRPDIPDLMQGADVYVHPAYRENTGLVILEALACGLPVLVTATCGYAFHVENAQAGYVAAAPFDQDSFNALFYGMMTSQERDAWSKNGLDYARNIMSANDGSAEAAVLVDIAANKGRP